MKTGVCLKNFGHDCSDHLKFIMQVKTLLDRTTKKGGQKRDIKVLDKIFGSPLEALSKLAVTTKGFRILFKL